MKIIPEPITFDWDIWNQVKNLVKHQVENKECEEVFLNEPLFIENDESHSLVEKRYKVLGLTKQNRLLMIVFTLRNDKIRVISARDQSKKEKLQFNKLKNDQEI